MWPDLVQSAVQELRYTTFDLRQPQANDWLQQLQPVFQHALAILGGSSERHALRKGLNVHIRPVFTYNLLPASYAVFFFYSNRIHLGTRSALRSQLVLLQWFSEARRQDQ
jgi:hypothetical protein